MFFNRLYVEMNSANKLVVRNKLHCDQVSILFKNRSCNQAEVDIIIFKPKINFVVIKYDVINERAKTNPIQEHQE